MKTSILAFAMFITAITSFAQTTPDAKTKEDYLRRSRHQKTAAWIMLGGGLTLVTIGFLAGVAEGVNYSLGDRDPSTGTGATLATIGAVSTFGSIPMFIIAGSSKRKAARLSFDMQKVQMPNVSNRVRMVRQPSVTVTVSF